MIDYTLNHGKGSLMKRVKEVCMLAGVSRRTLQYYDDTGVLPVERSDGNERLYSEEKLKKLSRILTYKRAGMKLEEIKDVIELPDEKQVHALREHIENLTGRKQEIEDQIKFIEFIIREGVPDFSDLNETARINGITTFTEYLEQVMQEACGGDE